MKLPPQAIREYQEIHREEYGEELSKKEAEQMAQKVFSFFTHVFHSSDHA